jgi:CelD/BcsL family acetyltransferase involved in cellulose biosynthesis
MQIIEIVSRESLAAEMAEWQNLAAQLRNPFADLNIYLSWLDIYAAGKQLLVLKIMDGQKLLSYVPLYKKNNSVGWLGEGRVNYLDLIAREEDKLKVWPAVLEHLNQKRIKTINLNNVSSLSATAQILQFHGFQKSEEKVCPYLDVNPNIPWVEFYNSVLKNKRRYEIRKTLEELSKLGEFKVVNKTRGEVTEQNIEEIFALYRKRWAETWRKNLIKPEYFEYQKKLLKNIDNAYLSLAYLGDKLISFIFGFYKNGIFTDYIVAHDPEYMNYSVGNLHVAKLIEELFAKGLKIFDFSIGEEVYKRKWAKAETWNYDLLKTTRLNLLLIKIKAKIKNIIKIILKKIK